VHGVVIRDARVPDEVDAVRALFEEYAASLDVDLCFQDFAREVAELPGAYAATRGCLLLAEDEALIVGCVALRPLANAPSTIGEIKRLYLRPQARGRGIGRLLAEAVVERGRHAGYRALKLDTLASMTAARALYATLGFRECAPYYSNPYPGVTYMELLLDTSGAQVAGSTA
jgi:ribosomal protein S18 acetylase RimI-like enzyme